MSRLSGIGNRRVAIALGVGLVVLVAVIAVTGDVGKADVGSDSVAVVDGDQISKEDFEKSLAQAAVGQGLEQAPPPSDPAYEALRDQALNDVLDTAWILGEAERQGVEVSDREVEQQFAQTKAQNFQSEQEYQDFLEQSGFTQEDVDQRVRLQALSTKIQEKVTGEPTAASEDDARKFYEANEEQFQQPESRNIRIVLNQDQAAVEDAAAQLKQDNSPENWAKIASAASTDEASKSDGGVRDSVTPGTFQGDLDTQIFDAAEGEVIGPVQTPEGFYVFQVDTVIPPATTSFDDARAQIDEQLSGLAQQEVFSAFLTDYRDRWIQLTVCGEDYLVERCDNFTGSTAPPCPDPSLPDDQQKQQLEEQGCPPPVLSSSPGAPGSFLPFAQPQGQPQRPHPPGEDTA
ncbi:MAG: peptidyl-prolyl cis-trans isomerase, partial [Actinomycetota bacterium]|nr:peptidyl-prolyl cis-trans isomerase [Actinomycetota bacterium]